MEKNTLNIGTTTPEEVSKALGIRELELNGKKEKINFWDQMNYPFLLDKSSTELFRFIVDSGEDDQVSAALKDMVSDRQNINKEINQIQGSIIVLDEQISSKTKTIEDLKPRVEVAKEIIKMQSKVSNVRQMSDLYDRIVELNTKYTDLKSKQFEVKNKADLIKSIVLKLQDSYEKNSIYSNTLDRIRKFSSKVKENEDYLSRYKIIFDSLEKVSEVNLMPLIEVRNSIQNITSKIDRLTSQKDVTFDIDTKDLEERLLKLTNMKTLIDKILVDKKLVLDKEKSIQSYTELLNKIHKVTSYIPVCPYCGQTIHNI